MMKNIFTTILLMMTLVSCNDYLDIEPVGQIIPKTVEDYRQFITSAYALPKNHKYLSAYRTDELKLDASSRGVEQYQDIYTWNDASPSPETLSFTYQNFYSTIFYVNEIINNKDKIEGNIDEVNQLVGEAYALRALQYFDLVNLYGKPYDSASANTDSGVPIVREYNAENEYPKATVKEVYEFIIADITNAYDLININKQPVGYNYRFSKVALFTLHSAVALSMKDWPIAIKTANEALGLQSELQNLNTVNDIMPAEYNSVESILALDATSSYDISSNALVSNELYDKYLSTDLRREILFNYTSQGIKFVKNANIKYKCTYRTSDLYLISSESYLSLDDIGNSIEKILKFAYNRYSAEEYFIFANKVSISTKAELLEIILNERQLEFALEGKRWFDLRRTTQPQITKLYNNTTITLNQADERYTLPFPREAIISNPLL